MIGENGAVTQIGIGLPPEFYQTVSISKKKKRRLHALREQLDETMPFSIWYQPNEIGLTCFFKTKDQQQALHDFFKQTIEPDEGLIVYEHADSFDITPEGINKKESLLQLLDLLHLRIEEIAAVGNGVNDYPMFEAAGFSIAIGKHDPSCATVLVNSIEEALALLLKMTEKSTAEEA